MVTYASYRRNLLRSNDRTSRFQHGDQASHGQNAGIGLCNPGRPNRSLILRSFSGSGIIALEASSRGAHPVVCVERDRAKFPILLKNVSIAERHIECKAQPVELFLARNRESFDLVFLDPPFPYAYRLDLLKVIAKKESLKPGGRLLIHFPREDRLPDSIASLRLEDERRYGRSFMRFYRKTEA